MSDIQYNLKFDKLCNNLNLGELTDVPEPISGGLLHKMFAIQTTSGKYAIKALNPQIMLRPKAIKDYIKSEKICNLAAKNVPALPAKIINGSSIQRLENQFFLIFDWIEGKSLKASEINASHSKIIGKILAEIHLTDFSKLNMVNDFFINEKETDWNLYLKIGQKRNSELVGILLDNIHNLYRWNNQANIARKYLTENMVISHGDLDSKNVMWKNDNPILIDWESAGFINPMYDMVDTAIYWAETCDGNIKKERFLAFVNGYKNRYGKLKANWRVILENGYLGKLEWLEYNLKRSMGIECMDEDEQKLGTEQAIDAINSLNHYALMASELENWLINETL